MPLVIAAAGAATIFMIFLVLSRVMSGNQTLEDRVQEFAGTPTAKSTDNSTSKEKFTNATDKLLTSRGFAQRAQRKLAQADLKLTVTEFMLIKVFTLVLGFMAGQIIGRDQGAITFVIALGTAFFGWIVPDLWVGRKQKGRIKAFNNQLGDTIILMANSLRSGYSFPQTMELIGRESPPPISVEFRRAVREIGLGIGVQESLNNLLKRVPSDDLDLMITAVQIQFEVGGNLATVLDTIAHTIRERVRIQGEIQTLTAMGRASGWIITFLPIALAAFIMLINPTYMSELFKWPWICMPICGGIMIAAGSWAIQKIVTIEV
jgi:tight adherence protein B